MLYEIASEIICIISSFLFHFFAITVDFVNKKSAFTALFFALAQDLVAMVLAKHKTLYYALRPSLPHPLLQALPLPGRQVHSVLPADWNPEKRTASDGQSSGHH